MVTPEYYAVRTERCRDAFIPLPGVAIAAVRKALSNNGIKTSGDTVADRDGIQFIEGYIEKNSHGQKVLVPTKSDEDEDEDFDLFG